MHDDLRSLSLTFPSIPVGTRETPPDLKRLLYKDGASVSVKKANKAIEEGLLGSIVPDRVELVRLIHEYISGELAGGGSPETAREQIKCISVLFDWADKTGAVLMLSNVLATYLMWSEHLLHRLRVVKDIKQVTAYNYVRACGQILDATLGRNAPMHRLTRIKNPKGRKTPQGAVADKENLQKTFAFGGLLQDICDGTPLSVIWGTAPPVLVPLKGGGEILLGVAGRPKRPDDERYAGQVRESTERYLERSPAYSTNRLLGHDRRADIVNVRIMAEMLMFIGQTGKNLAGTIALPLFRVCYQSDTDGYKVLDYKKRAGGEVLFNIYSEYRNHFDRYLEWRRSIFPESEQRLFPIIRAEGTRQSSRPNFKAIQNLCRQAGVSWTPPRALRGTRVNWLLRRSGDPDLTAEMAQHSKEVLLRVYDKPSQQRAMAEIAVFWARNDPSLTDKKPLHAVGPGECSGVPNANPGKPKSAPSPDCIAASGCLWCDSHRDIDTLDYLWSLACFRHLKIIELSKHCPPANAQQTSHPAEHAIQRASEKMTWFRDSNNQRREWVEEALARVREGSYHDQWSYLIEAMEGPFK